MQTDPFLVVDLEATCDERGWDINDSEIIEIGAVLVRGDTLDPLDEFATFVRPTHRPELTAFCTKLTTIRQADVDAAPRFPEAIEALSAWLAGRSVHLAFWGAYDRNQFSRDRKRHRVTLPWDKRHLNIKQAFADQLGRRPMGMAQALSIVGLDLVGTHHRGIDDARNIARLLPYALGRLSPR